MDPRSVYRETAVQGATPLRLVVLLYEQAVQDLQRAIAAVDEKNVERRTFEINHALSVVGQLQGSLDMQSGGEVARNLDRFYSLLRTNLLQAQSSSSREILHKQVKNLLELRDAWLEVEQGALVSARQQFASATSGNDQVPRKWEV